MCKAIIVARLRKRMSLPSFSEQLMGKRVPCKDEVKRAKNVLARQKRDVSFCKRRKTVFSKASKLCIKHGTQIAVLVLSPSGKPYAFGHTSVDAVLNQYFNVKKEEESQQPRASVMNNEERNMVECMKEGIENELRACQTVQDFALLRERLRELYKKTNERLNNSMSSEYKLTSEEDHIMYRMRTSGINMVSPNYLPEPAPCPLPSFSASHGPCHNGGLSSGYGNYVVNDHVYYGKNNNGCYGGASWGTEHVENIMPSYLSKSSSSSLLSSNFYEHPPSALVHNFSAHDVSVNDHAGSSNVNNYHGGHAYGNNNYLGEKSLLGVQCEDNVVLRHDVSRYDSRASTASYLSGSLSSDNSLFVDPPCPLPNTNDQAYSPEFNYGEGSHEVLPSIELGHVDPDDENPFEATICLSGTPSSNNSFTIDSPSCPNLPNDQACDADMCGEGSYNVLHNMELSHEPDNVNNSFEAATINLSGTSSSNTSLFMDSSCQLPNSSPVPSLESRRGSTDDQAYGSDISSWEGSYEVLGNIGLGQDDPDTDNPFGSTIYLPGDSCSSPPSPDSIFPACPSPNIFGAGHHDLDDEDITLDQSVDVSLPGASVCPSTNGAIFNTLIGSSSESVQHSYIDGNCNYFDNTARSASSESARYKLNGHCNYFDAPVRTTLDSTQQNAYQRTTPLLKVLA